MYIVKSISRVLFVVVPFFVLAAFFIDSITYDASNRFFASVFPVNVTSKDLRKKYDAGKVNILLVPGHDLEFPGAAFGNVKEADLTLKLAKDLFEILKTDERFLVFTTRDTENGNYTKEFSSYFSADRSKIQSFRKRLRETMRALVGLGKIKERVVISHNFAPSETAIRLYGINKWANEHDIDIVLHIHFNDYAGRNYGVPGRYNGFVIYAPESQYPNAEASMSLARALHGYLKKRLPESDFPLERGGIIEDQDLIAVGANASRIGASLLVEYGYIYESQFRYPEARKSATRELAFQTYQGLKTYFGDMPKKFAYRYNTTLLPYQWNSSLQKGIKGKSDIFALQAALFEENLYPPAKKTLSECPLNGNFGPCTERSVKLFQEKYQASILRPLNIYAATGIVGPSTLKKLNALYSIAK